MQGIHESESSIITLRIAIINAIVVVTFTLLLCLCFGFIPYSHSLIVVSILGFLINVYCFLNAGINIDNFYVAVVNLLYKAIILYVQSMSQDYSFLFACQSFALLQILVPSLTIFILLKLLDIPY